MVRDWDLIRKILVATEEKQPGQTVGAKSFEGYSPAIVGPHIALLKDGGFVTAAINPGFAGAVFQAEVLDLTFEGHDLLDTIRNKGDIGEDQIDRQREGN